MAINFLNAVSIAGNLDLNQNQLVQFRVENLTSNPTATAGRLYYNSTDGSLRYYNGDSTAWITLDGTGDVDSIAVANGAASTGNALSVNSSTGSVTISSRAYDGGSDVGHVPVGGSATTFLRGDGSWATPGGTYTSWTISDGSSSSTVTDGQTVTISGSTGIDAAESSRTVALTLDLNELTTVTAVSSDFVSIVDATDNSTKKALISDIISLTGDITAVNASTTNNRKGIAVANAAGPIPEVGLNIVGQTNLGATPSGSDELIIYDADTATNKAITVTNLLAAAPQGDITGVTGSSGITVSSGSGPVPNVSVLYTGAGNVVDAAGAGSTIESSDKILYEDGTDTTVKEIAISSLIALAPQGDITAVVAGTKLNGGGTSGSVTLNHDTTSRSNTTSTDTVGSGGTFTKIDSITTNATGHVTAVNTETITMGAFDNYGSWTISDGSNTSSVGSGQTVTIQGTSNEVEVSESGRTVTVGLPTNVTIGGDLTVSGGDITLSGTGRIQGIDTVTASTDAASKNYVDQQLAGSGLLIFQGGYNAATNTPDLDSSPSSSIKKGWSYVVTAAGSFFSETVEVGDLLIAQQDAPTTLANWVTVQNNIGLATTTTPGIASFSSDNFAVSAAGVVTVKNNGIILGTETTGNYTATVAASSTNNRKGIAVSGATGEGQAAVVGLNITGQSALATVAADDELIIYDTSSTTNVKVPVSAVRDKIVNDNSFSGTFPTSDAASFTVSHGLSSKDIIVQVYRISDGATIFAQVERTSNSVVTVTCSSAQTADTLQVLCTKCV